MLRVTVYVDRDVLYGRALLPGSIWNASTYQSCELALLVVVQLRNGARLSSSVPGVVNVPHIRTQPSVWVSSTVMLTNVDPPSFTCTSPTTGIAASSRRK